MRTVTRTVEERVFDLGDIVKLFEYEHCFNDRMLKSFQRHPSLWMVVEVDDDTIVLRHPDFLEMKRLPAQDHCAWNEPNQNGVADCTWDECQESFTLGTETYKQRQKEQHLEEARMRGLA